MIFGSLLLRRNRINSQLIMAKESENLNLNDRYQEMMTIVILFHQSNDRTVKHFDGYVTNYLGKEFPNLMGTSRFVYLKKNLFGPVFTYLLKKREEITRIAFIDFPSIDVCHNKRIKETRSLKA
ncbi:hypothetical protein DB44_CW00890 [Candidatus Protochlamydia amoebophila]|uniref:Transposase DDE domain-containing protein n=1 Tax=Candidatus Protochlamydia amoebophila TaxID=362787 RepID=A0A0C1JMW8_9BACT|nr:hypothetical protein DB44_CW00890 [Candidatus Protochlamydia amoebophila]